MKSEQPNKVKFATSTSGPSQNSQRIDRQATRMFVQKQKSRMGPDMLKHAPSSMNAVGAHPSSQLERQMTRSNNQVQTVRPLHLDDTERLDFQVDASSNITHEPTDKQIRRQIQRWKTEYALSRTEEAPQHVHTKALKPKHTKSFYDLRKAMVNRETVSLEKSTVRIKTVAKDTLKAAADETLEPDSGKRVPKLLKIQDSANFSTNKLVTREEEIKVYTKESTFELAISKNYPPGFNVASDSTELEKECKNTVKKLNARERESDFRNEIDEVLKLWKTSGFLKNIEEFVLSVPLTNNNSVSEIAQLIASPISSYLMSLSNKVVCTQLARAYAIYCWIANHIILSDEKQYAFLSDDDETEKQSAAFKYCTLFVELALHANLEAEVVNGQVRTWKKLTDDDLNVPTPHSWNVVSFA